MVCQNCGKNEANVKYTQIVNGVKKEMALCDKCAKKLGLYNDMDFNMPISMSSFLGNMLSDYEDETFLPSFSGIATSKCNNCKTDYDEFIETGLLGCENCYNVFSNKIDSLLKNIHGSNRHVGRISKFIENSNNLGDFKPVEKKIKTNKTERASKIEELKEKRFSILEEVKSINIGNDMDVTISIGIGINGANYVQNYEYSRIAIDLALGRGGDQVVIKDRDTMIYFGGKSQQMGKTTRVKARVKAHALKEFMVAKDKVVVMGHKISDVDSIGAGIGIYRAAKSLNKRAHIVVNNPTMSVRPIIENFINNPEYDEHMFVNSAEAKEIVDNNTVVVVVDTNKPSYTECEDLLSKTKTIVVLDHHRQGAEVISNAVLSYIEPFASSACEMVAEILQYFSDGIRIYNIEADALYAGIVIDTDNFTSKTGVRTFEAAAFLRRCGADVTRVRKMFRDDVSSYRAKAETVRTVETYRDSFAIGICPSSGLDSPTIVAAQAANELLDIDSIKASFVLTDYNNLIYISARAIDEVNVQLIMERLGGGGHINVAGAQLKDATVNGAIIQLKDTIDQMIKEGAI